jgi:probable F420-dependent oxidoreductase
VIGVSVQGQASDGGGWLNLARTVEDLGFDTLYVADHPGALPSPFVLLAAASSVTQRINLGTCVANVGLWEPYDLAAEVSTLDLLSDGRAILGLGAGHTPSEWRMQGASIPSPSRRVARLVAVASATRSLLAGETVTQGSEFVNLTEASLAAPPKRHVPVMIGGAGPKVLRLAAATADIVGVTGLGKTLADGHHHQVDWSESSLDRMFDLVRSVASQFGRQPEVEALVQHAEITDDPLATATRLSDAVPGATPSDILGSPFVWLGTADSIARRLRADEERWGINRYVVRAGSLTPAHAVLQRLRSM